MKVRYTRRALAHLSEIRAYIAQDRPGSAKAVGETIRAAAAHLAQFPEAGRPGRVSGTRELVVPRLPFVVAYRVAEGHIDILAILHGARRWPSSFES